MKKFVSVILCISLMTAFASCSATSTEDKEDDRARIEDDDDEDKDEDEEETEVTTETSETSDTASTDVVTGNHVTFSTVDREGNTYDDSVFSHHIHDKNKRHLSDKKLRTQIINDIPSHLK